MYNNKIFNSRADSNIVCNPNIYAADVQFIYQVYEWMDMVVDEYPSIATKRQFGVTYEGRPLYVLEFSKGIGPNRKPKIFVDALIHCREWITTASLLFIFKEVSGNSIYNI